VSDVTRAVALWQQFWPDRRPPAKGLEDLAGRYGLSVLIAALADCGDEGVTNPFPAVRAACESLARERTARQREDSLAAWKAHVEAEQARRRDGRYVAKGRAWARNLRDYAAGRITREEMLRRTASIAAQGPVTSVPGGGTWDDWLVEALAEVEADRSRRASGTHAGSLRLDLAGAVTGLPDEPF
jgi:hypothetical protein